MFRFLRYIHLPPKSSPVAMDWISCVRFRHTPKAKRENGAEILSSSGCEMIAFTRNPAAMDWISCARFRHTPKAKREKSVPFLPGRISGKHRHMERNETQHPCPSDLWGQGCVRLKRGSKWQRRLAAGQRFVRLNADRQPVALLQRRATPLSRAAWATALDTASLTRGSKAAGMM